MRLARVCDLDAGDLALIEIEGSLMLCLALQPVSDEAVELVLIERVGGSPYEEALPALEVVEPRFQTLACQIGGETRITVTREAGTFGALGKLPDGAYLHLLETGPCLRVVNHENSRQVLFVDLLSGERVRPRLNKCFTVSAWELRKEHNGKCQWSRAFDLKPEAPAASLYSIRE